jgi:hypothetical protein
MEERFIYKFNYDITRPANIALADLLNAGWIIQDIVIEDGCRWINLIKFQ